MLAALPHAAFVLHLVCLSVCSVPVSFTIYVPTEFTRNKILFKVFGAMSKNYYSYIYECFGIDTADQFIRKHQDMFINKFCASDNLFCRVIYDRQ